jgi:hypothetical protein
VELHSFAINHLKEVVTSNGRYLASSIIPQFVSTLVTENLQKIAISVFRVV